MSNAPDPDKVHLDAALKALDGAVMPTLYKAAAEDAGAAREAAAAVSQRLAQFAAFLAGTVAGGTPASNGSGSGSGRQAGVDLTELGRNQRAKLRELTILECLSRDGGPQTIQALMADLRSNGFTDDQPAVVSAVARLRESGMVASLGPGTYAMADPGIKHMHLLQRTMGPLRGR